MSVRIVLVTLGALGALMLGPAASAQAPTPAPAASPPSPAMLLPKMHQLDQMEMKLGQLAEQKGTTGEVRRYGKLLFRDHRMADHLVTQAAQRRGVALAPPPPSSPQEQMQMQQQMQMTQDLQGSSGPEFDRKLVTAADKTQSMALDMLEKAGPMLPDAQLRGMLGRMTPILRQHVEIAKNLEKR